MDHTLTTKAFNIPSLTYSAANPEPDETKQQLKYTSSTDTEFSADVSLSERSIKEQQPKSSSSETDFKAVDHRGVTVAMKIAALGNVAKFKELLEENRNALPEKAIDFGQTNIMNNNLIDIILLYEQNEILDILIKYFNSGNEESYLANVEFFIKIVASNLKSSDKKAAIMKLPTINTELTAEQKNTFEAQYAKLIKFMVDVTDIETIKKLYSIITQLNPDKEYLQQQEVIDTKTLIAVQAGLAGNIEVLKFLVSDDEMQVLNEIQDVNQRDILMRIILSDIPDKVTIFNNLMEYSRRRFVFNHQDKDGKTVAMHAAEKNEIDILQALVIEHSLNILYVKNDQGKDSLYFASEAGNTELYTEVLQREAQRVHSRKKQQKDRDVEVERLSKKYPFSMMQRSGAVSQLSSDQRFDDDTRLAIERSFLEK